MLDRAIYLTAHCTPAISSSPPPSQANTRFYQIQLLVFAEDRFQTTRITGETMTRCSRPL